MLFFLQILLINEGPRVAADMAAGIAPAKAIDLMSDNLVMLPESIHVRQEWRGERAWLVLLKLFFGKACFLTFFSAE
ncbi:hypothetical protein [Pseudomonas sp. OHS18]|uniref:hypothetical protein n=1 Tax=Pseudomonas sp. OHS18 TaxID=3399679 RepID=UPI003A882619